MAKYKKFAIPEGYYYLKDLAKGEFVKRSATAKKVYAKGSYDPVYKGFWLDDLYDISGGMFAKRNAKVYAGFTY